MLVEQKELWPGLSLTMRLGITACGEGLGVKAVFLPSMWPFPPSRTVNVHPQAALHRVTAWLRLEGTLGGHLAQLSTQTREKREKKKERKMAFKF